MTMTEPYWWISPTVMYIYYPELGMHYELRADVNSAWECPRCRSIYAPWVRSCGCDPPFGTVSSTVTNPASGLKW